MYFIEPSANALREHQIRAIGSENNHIHSFIHIEHLYSATSRKDYSESEALPTAVWLKRTVFKREKDKRDKVLGKRRSKLKWKTIPGRGSHDRESSILPNGGTGERKTENTLVR